MPEADTRLPWRVASVVFLADVALVVSTIVLDKTNHVAPPAAGDINTAAAIGWLGVASAIFIFGCFGILIKTPAVVQAKVDAMVFQCYYATATAFVSFLIWALAGSSAGLTFNAGSFLMGALFGLFWIVSQLCAFYAIQILGYAVGPAIWIGITICVSFVWGTAAFGHPVKNVAGAAVALIVLLMGVCLAAGSSHLSALRQQRARQRVPPMEVQGLTDAQGSRKSAESSSSGSPPGSVFFGLVCCVGVGLFNGSLMVPLQCFQEGCKSLGVRAFEGDILAPLAFLPSLAVGIMAVLPIIFCVCYWRLLLARRWPNFHFKVVALPGFLTGVFWGMGNFNAMFATVYLGQTIGYPLTQLCLIISGLWGILYYKEISGAAPIGLFALASVVIIVGAALDGMYA